MSGNLRDLASSIGARFMMLRRGSWKRSRSTSTRARARTTLSFAARQMVELAKALTLEEHAAGHLVILLDEPTSVLERADIDVLFNRVRALKSRASFVFVSHRLDEVLQVSDRVYVMKDGEVVAELAAADANVATLHRLMVGRTLQADYYYEPLQKPVQDKVVLEADGLACGAAYRNVSFKLRAGEVLGIAGVIGSGREELTRTLAGFSPHTAGNLKVAAARCGSRRQPTRSISALATSRANGGSRGSFCSCPFRPTSLWPISQPHALRFDRLPEGARRCDGLDLPAQNPHAEHPHPVPWPFRRQPAEGRSREVAERQGENSHPRSPNPRPGRGRQGGGLRAHSRPDRRRSRNRSDFGHFGGDHRAQPQRSSSCATAKLRTAPTPARGAKPQQVDLIGYMV